VLAKSLLVAAGIAVCAALIGVAGDAVAARRDWTGSGACGSCHPKQLAAWQTTRHAMTRDRFPQRPAGTCLGCHGTGEAPAGTAIAVEVGCEACHGAGAAYATDDLMRNKVAAQALGLADLSTPKARTALCMQCHARMTSSKTFDPAAPVHAVGTAPLVKP
jgi:hypothetical protein